MTPTYLYTIRAGASVRVPWQNITWRDCTNALGVKVQRPDFSQAWVDMTQAEPYTEPPLRAKATTDEQRRLDFMIEHRMRSTDNANAGLTRNGKQRKRKAGNVV